MYVVELAFENSKEQSRDRNAMSHAVHGLLGSLRMNGQICGREWPIALSENSCRAMALVPDRDAFDAVHHNKYVHAAIEKLADVGLGGPQVTVLGEELESDPVCTCPLPTAYILYTNFLSLESPVRCGDCFHPIPLYRIPRDADDEYYKIIVWQSDYQSCDSLQMNCRTLERAATRALSWIDSSLSRQGRDVCHWIAKQMGKPVYHYLFRYGGRSRSQEGKRRCPSCGGPWLLDRPWHDLFDFRCDNCHLLSNIAWDVK